MRRSAPQAVQNPPTTPYEIRTDLSRDGVVEISGALRLMLADVFSLYLKTKNFHWHMTGRHFRDYHLLLDEHSDHATPMSFKDSASLAINNRCVSL